MLLVLMSLHAGAGLFWMVWLALEMGFSTP